MQTKQHACTNYNVKVAERIIQYEDHSFISVTLNGGRNCWIQRANLSFGLNSVLDWIFVSKWILNCLFERQGDVEFDNSN